MSKIDTLVFDFGNVIIDLDLKQTFIQLEQLLGKGTMAKLRADNVFNLHETGKLGDESYLNRMQLAAEGAVPHGQRLVDAWNAMLLGIPTQRLEFLESLIGKYRVILLSNTNQIHIDWVDRHLRRDHNLTIKEYEDRYFAKAYYSHVIGMRKPDSEIYDWVAQDAHLDLTTSLFIDDNEANVEAAKAAGWKAQLHPIGTKIEEVLVTYLSNHVV